MVFRLGLIKSFVDSFFVFWSGTLLLILLVDVRAIIFKELPPLTSLYYTSEIIFSSVYQIFFNLDINTLSITGLIVFLVSAVLLGILSKSPFDIIWTGLIFTSLLFILALPLDSFIYYMFQSGGNIGQALHQTGNINLKVLYALTDLMLFIPLALVGRSYALEKEPETSKEIEI